MSARALSFPAHRLPSFHSLPRRTRTRSRTSASAAATYDASTTVGIHRMIRHFNNFDGVTKPSWEQCEKDTLALFHPDVQIKTDQGVHDRDYWMAAVKALHGKMISNIISIKQISDDQIEYRIDVVTAEQGILPAHSIGSFKDGQLWRIEPFNADLYGKMAAAAISGTPDGKTDARTELDMEQVAQMHNLLRYFAMYTPDDTVARDVAKLEAQLPVTFHPDLAMPMGEGYKTRSELLAAVKPLYESKCSCDIRSIERTGPDTITYRVDVRAADGSLMLTSNMAAQFKGGQYLTATDMSGGANQTFEKMFAASGK